MRETDEEDELLAEEIARAGMAGARLAGFGGFPRLTTAPARWLSRHQPKNVREGWLRLPGHPEMVRDRAIQVLDDHGELIDTHTDQDCSYRVRGMVHYGRHGWARAVATITIQPSSGGYNDVHVRSVSKEGWAKSRFGQGCVPLVTEALPLTIPDYGAPQ
jgi:hypothetical protein